MTERPSPDVVEEQWHASDGTVLAGTLLRPEASGSGRPDCARPPAVLLLSGSGPVDRDSNMEDQATDISKTLAHHLVQFGIASLRYDKRGTGASGGEYPLTGFHTEFDDAASALHHLATRCDIDPERVGVVGHSVGATLAMRLAASVPDVAGAVLLAGASSSGAEVLEWQSERIGQTLPGPSWLSGRLFRWAQKRSHAKLTDPTTESVTSRGVSMSGRWFREYRAYDPAEDLRGITCPVLAITGGKDLQVDPSELTTIAALVGGPCRTESPPDLTHVLRSSAGPPTISRYRELIAEPVDSGVLAVVGAWLSETLDRRGTTPR